MGHVDALRLAPFGNDVAVVDDEAGFVAPRLDGADRVAERLAAERLIVVHHEIARILGLAGDGEIDRRLETRRIEARSPTVPYAAMSPRGSTAPVGRTARPPAAAPLTT